MAIEQMNEQLRFQFLMVQLKDMEEDYSEYYFSEFQFLMVQLKGATTSRIITSVLYISIPYGSIKSHSDCHKRNSYNCISIPYGSIKSRNWCSYNCG